jgi:hypothetical protein
LRFTAERTTGRLLGLQLFGHIDTQIAERVDTAAAAIFAGMSIEALNDLDLSCTPPLGASWDALQTGAQQWTKSAASSDRSGRDASAHELAARAHDEP